MKLYDWLVKKLSERLFSEKHKVMQKKWQLSRLQKAVNDAKRQRQQGK